jgi:DNA invertase Pin-like site-specific DNA recombinase
MSVRSIDAQVKQLRSAGAEKVWRETASGAKTDRAQLRRLLDQLDAGDVLLVTRLDRLARSTRDLLNILAMNAYRNPVSHRALQIELEEAWNQIPSATIEEVC